MVVPAAAGSAWAGKPDGCTPANSAANIALLVGALPMHVQGYDLPNAALDSAAEQTAAGLDCLTDVNYNSDTEPFNNNMSPNTSKKTQPLQAQSSPVTFKCDIHPWMQGRARVFDHPYFATTDADGKFEIKNAPQGKWRIVYWHENGFHQGAKGALGFEVDATKGDVELKPIELELPK